MGSTYQPPNKVCRTLLNQYDPQLLDVFKTEMAYGVERFFLLSYCLACCWPGFNAKSNLRVVRQWTELDFVYPSERDRINAIQKNYYIQGNSVPLDMDVQHGQGAQKSRIFITIPRFDAGRPMTLATVQDDGRLAAYPDYSWHDNQGMNCYGLTSVFRTAIDKCNRLWVMDTGKIGDDQVCPPQLLAFDLNTDQLVYRHIVNNTKYIDTSLFVTPVVDVRGFEDNDCTDTYVYVADVSGFGLLVVDVATDRSWRVTHKLFYPYPSSGTFTIDGESFDLMDGVLGMALSPYRPGRDRYLYFHALASNTENVVSTSVLRNDSFIHDSNANPSSINFDDCHNMATPFIIPINSSKTSMVTGPTEEYPVFPEQRPTQSAAEAIDHNGIMYFGMMDPPAIYCWNTATEFTPRNFHQIALDQETLQFASGMKIINNLKGQQELWVLTSSFQRVMTGTLNSNRVNFRIHAEKIPVILQNSPCLNPPKGQNPGHHANIISQGKSKTTWRYGARAFL